MNRNPFLMMSQHEARSVIAENLSLIMGNNVTSRALARRAVESDEVFVDLHLVDRVGAVVNALAVLGYELGAERFYQELKEQNKLQREDMQDGR